MGANKRVYRKNINMVLETRAQNKEEAMLLLNDVAHSIYSNDHPFLVGGKKKREVTMLHSSTDTVHVPKHQL